MSFVRPQGGWPDFRGTNPVVVNAQPAVPTDKLGRARDMGLQSKKPPVLLCFRLAKRRRPRNPLLYGLLMLHG